MATRKPATKSASKKIVAGKKKSAGKTSKPAAKKPLRKARVSAVPDGFRTITPYIIVRGAGTAISFYEKAFGAKLKTRMAGPGGSVMHAEVKIGDSMLMISDENPQWGALSPLSLGGSPTHVMFYVKDVDAFVARALAAGATLEMPISDMFWGDRYGKVKDPFGHVWSVATHTENVPAKEMKKRAEAFVSGG